MTESIIKIIQGTWLLSSMKIIYSNGQTIDMYGENPLGITVFDANGYMTAQMGSSTRSNFVSDIVNQGTSEEIMGAYKSYMAFFGRYSEHSTGTLIIKLDSCLFPNWQGKEIIRYAEVVDNFLYLTTPPTKLGSDNIIVKAIWQRPLAF